MDNITNLLTASITRSEDFYRIENECKYRLKLLLCPLPRPIILKKATKKKLRIRNVGNKMKIFSFFFLDHEYLSS